jgi:predicted ArsR family transcriptional regulator
VSDRSPEVDPPLADVSVLGPLGALIPEGERLALAYARGRSEPFTAEAATEALGGSRASMRRRLERLEELGLLRSEFRRLGGREGPGAGRPAKLYSAAPEVEVHEFPARHMTGLIRMLVEEARVGHGRLRRLGRRFAGLFAPASEAGEAEDLGDAVGRACAALAAHGFVARVVDVSPDEVVLAVPTCPLRPLVREAPGAVEIDRGLWEGLVAQAAGRGLTVRCLTERCLDVNQDCTVTVGLAGERNT